MKEYFKMTFVLTAISALSAFLLAATDRVTKAPIALALKMEKIKSVNRVLPEHDNDPAESAVVVPDGEKEWTFYVARKSGAFAGAAFTVASDKGYSGYIEAMVGVSADGRICGVEALRQNETPGLGAKIADKRDGFMAQFKGREIAGGGWAVEKDGGTIHAITGATITSRAVTGALKQGLEIYSRHKDAIAGGQDAGAAGADKAEITPPGGRG